MSVPPEEQSGYGVAVGPQGSPPSPHSRSPQQWDATHRGTRPDSSVRSVLERAFAEAPIGMALVDMAGRTLQVNEALCHITGYAARRACGRPFRDFCSPYDADADASHRLDLLEGRIRTYHVEMRYRHALGHAVDVLVSASLVRDETGQPLNLIVQVQDISERKTREARLEHLVSHDHLTGLFNAHHFRGALAQEVRSAARYGCGGAVVLLDLDQFKQVNDQFGHQAGDDLLKSVATALQGRARDTDVLARLGGDEFGIILPQVDDRQATVAADGIIRALRGHMASLAEHQLSATASIGVALFDGLTNVDVLAAADLAMYEAKRSGGNRWVLYHPPAGVRQTASSAVPETDRALVGGGRSRPTGLDR